MWERGGILTELAAPAGLAQECAASAQTCVKTTEVTARKDASGVMFLSSVTCTSWHPVQCRLCANPE